MAHYENNKENHEKYIIYQFIYTWLLTMCSALQNIQKKYNNLQIDTENMLNTRHNARVLE